MRKKIDVADLAGTPDADVEGLYVEFLTQFYERRDDDAATTIANRLEEMLAASPELARSIRGEEIRSLIAELHDDLARAIDCRQAEIRKILELHTLTVNTPNWEFVAGQYDFSDVSDRLDLLACLYDQQGNRDRAIATLRESRNYCASHGIPFDGADLLRELEVEEKKLTRGGRTKSISDNSNRGRRKTTAKSRA